MFTTESLADLGVACFPGADLGVEAGRDRVGQAWACRWHAEGTASLMGSTGRYNSTHPTPP